MRSHLILIMAIMISACQHKSPPQVENQARNSLFIQCGSLTANFTEFKLYQINDRKLIQTIKPCHIFNDSSKSEVIHKISFKSKFPYLPMGQRLSVQDDLPIIINPGELRQIQIMGSYEVSDSFYREASGMFSENKFYSHSDFHKIPRDPRYLPWLMAKIDHKYLETLGFPAKENLPKQDVIVHRMRFHFMNQEYADIFYSPFMNQSPLRLTYASDGLQDRYNYDNRLLWRNNLEDIARKLRREGKMRTGKFFVEDLGRDVCFDNGATVNCDTNELMADNWFGMEGSSH